MDVEERHAAGRVGEVREPVKELRAASEKLRGEPVGVGRDALCPVPR